VAQQLKSDTDCRIFEVFTQKHTHTRQDSSEQVTGPSQRTIPTQYKTNTRDEHPCHDWDRQNSQSLLQEMVKVRRNLQNIQHVLRQLTNNILNDRQMCKR
jgi:hypothetical protein